MKRVMLVWLAAALLAACAAPATPEPTPAPTEAAAKTGTYRYAFSGESNVRDIPLLMAFDSLQADGYTVDLVNLAESAMVPEVLVRGDADLASFNVRGTWPAIAGGADLRTIAIPWASTFAVVTKASIAECADLDGVGVAFTSVRGINQVLLKKYLDDNCPGTVPEILTVAGSGARAAGLLAGDLEAAQLETENIVDLESQAPGEFRIYLNYGQAFPEVYVSSYGVNRAWAESHPEMVKDFLRAVLLAQRALQGQPETLANEIVARLSYEPAEAQGLAAAYLNPNIWYLNGGLTAETVQYNIDLLTENGDLEPGVKVEDLADFSYLEAVLAEIGTQ